MFWWSEKIYIAVRRNIITFSKVCNVTLTDIRGIVLDEVCAELSIILISVVVFMTALRCR